eukprot:3157470-Prymnesium_polylepis.1
MVEVVKDTESRGVELRRGLAHCASKHAHRERDVRPRLRRAVHEGANDALILLEQLRRRRIGLGERVGNKSGEALIARGLLAREPALERLVRREDAHELLNVGALHSSEY